MDKRIKEKLEQKKRNQIIAGVVLGASILIGMFYLFSKPEVIANVKTMPVESRNLTSVLEYTSNVMPAGIQSEYAPNQKIIKLHVNVGDRVVKGQLLAELDTSQLEKMVSDTESAFLKANEAMDIANLGMLNPGMLSSMLPGMSTEAIMAQLTSNLQSSLIESIKGVGNDVLGDLEFPDLSNVPALTADQKIKLLDALSKMENQVGETTYTLADFQLPKLDYILGLDSVGQSRMMATLLKMSADLRSFIDSKGSINNLPRDLASLTEGEKEILYNNINTLVAEYESKTLENNPLVPTENSEVSQNGSNNNSNVNNNGSANNSGNNVNKPNGQPNTSANNKPTNDNKEDQKDKNIIITDLSILTKQERGVLYSQYGRLLQDLQNYLENGADVNLPESIRDLSTDKKWELLRELRDVFNDLKKEFDSGMKDFDLGLYYKDNVFNPPKVITVSSFGGFNMDLFSGTMDQGGNILNQLQYANTSASEMLQKAKKEIYAEFDGLVVSINGKEGETISATSTNPFIEIYDDRYLTITIFANRNDSLKINLGQKVKYKVDDLELEGEVIFKSPIATENSGGITSITGGEPTVKIIMDIKGENVKDLIIGFPIDASIEVDSVKNAISAPAQSIFKDKDNYYVYVLKDDYIRKRKIEIGVQTQEFVEVKAGLLIGDKVVINPNSNLKDGQKVVVDE